jgi:predicted nucleic acid-binding protein
VLNELYVTITRKLPSPLPTDDAWEFVHALMVWEPQEISGDLLLNAREVEQRYRFGWWDSLVVAAAQLQECSLLLSEDLQDGMQAGGVTIRNPFTMRVAENSAPYAVAAPSAARHRPRGRPRRVVRPAAS